MKSASAKQPIFESQIKALASAMEKMIGAGQVDDAIDLAMEVITDYKKENDRLGILLKAAIRAKYGRKSEKLSPEQLGQLSLAFGEEENASKSDDPPVPVESNLQDKLKVPPKKTGKNRRLNHKGRRPLDDKLTKVIIPVPVAPEEKKCLHCGEEMQCIGHVDKETVEFIPARIEVHVHRYEKVACKTCKQDITCADQTTSNSKKSNESDSNLPMPNNCRVGVSLLAHLLEAKCDDGLPIYRIKQQFSRYGFDVPLNTLYDYWKIAAKMVYPVAQVVLSEVLHQAIVGVDDTMLNWLDPDEKSRKKRGHLWCFVGSGPLVAFEFTKSWKAEDVAPWLQNIEGYIQCDDYRGYSSKIKLEDGNLSSLIDEERRLGCMMHVRRKFYDAYQAGEKHALIALTMIKNLYQLEKQANDSNLSAAERHELRRQKSYPILIQLIDWAKNQENGLPTSLVTKAALYFAQQRIYIERCFSDGRFELDNGRVERQIREPVIGRKNYMFTGSYESAQLLANAYTLVCSCQNLKISTRDYLIDIMTKIKNGFPLRRINELRPDLWSGNN